MENLTGSRRGGGPGSARWWVFVLVLLVLVGLQWPFLQADADEQLGFSRGPFTDEGLYTGQVRNALRTGVLDLAESDGVIKEPLFALVAWTVLAGVEDSLVAMRAAMLVLCAAVFALVAAGRSSFSRAVLVGLPAVALSYYPFHYGHLALVEATGGALIIAALWAAHRRLTGGDAGGLALSALLIFLAYGLKVQFVYAAAIPPLAMALAALMRWAGGQRPGRRAVIDVLGASAAAMAFAGVFLVGWVLPNRALMSFVLGAQTSQRSSASGKLVATVMDNLHLLATDRRTWAVLAFAGLGLMAAVAAGRLAWKREGRAGWPAYVALMAPPLAWLLIELHKLTLSYLPSRYFTPLLVALGLVGAAGLTALHAAWSARAALAEDKAGSGSGGGAVSPGDRRPAPWITRAATVLLVPLLTLVLDARDYAHAWQRRSYAIRDTQRLLAAEGRWDGQLVMGPWAATLFWGSGALTKPVWKGYFNEREVMRTLHPVALVSEPDEADSERAFASNGITLGTPIHSVKIRNWTVNLYPPPAPLTPPTPLTPTQQP